MFEHIGSIWSILLEAMPSVLSTVSTLNKQNNKTAEVNSKEDGATERKRIEEDGLTDRKRIEEDGSTEKIRIQENQQTSRHFVDGVSNISDNMTNVSNTAMISNTDISKDSMKLSSESMSNNKEIVNKSLDMVTNIIRKENENISEQKNIQREEESRKNQILEEYKKSSQIINKELLEFEAKEKLHNELSTKLLTLVEKKANYEKYIDDTEDFIERKKRELEPLKKALLVTHTEMMILDRQYTELNNDFDKQIKIIEELKFEYKDTMSQDKYSENISRKERELYKLKDAIEHKELELLNRELDILNQIEEIEPKQNVLEELESSLKCRKNDQKKMSHIESIKLITTKVDSQDAYQLDTNEFIDAEVIENKPMNKK